MDGSYSTVQLPCWSCGRAALQLAAFVSKGAPVTFFGREKAKKKPSARRWGGLSAVHTDQVAGVLYWERNQIESAVDDTRDPLLTFPFDPIAIQAARAPPASLERIELPRIRRMHVAHALTLIP